jgi:transcriptional regulator with XRE-family HTH domain
MLRARRVNLGLSSEQLGRMLNVNGTTIRNWENGAVPVTACRILSWLFAEDDTTHEAWRERALLAEAALKDVHMAMTEYRDGHARRKIETEVAEIETRSQRVRTARQKA